MGTVRIAGFVLGLMALCVNTHGALAATPFDGSLLASVRLTIEGAAVIASGRQQIRISEAQVLSAQADFDPRLKAGISRLTSHTPLAFPLRSAIQTEQFDQSLTYSFGLDKKFRSGLQFSPTLSIYRASGDITNTSTPAVSRIALDFVLPLLQGQGRQINTAAERAAMLENEAAAEAYRHTLSAAITQSVSSYWDWLAALRSLEIARASEQRAQTLLGNAGKLIRGDAVPPADINKYEANLALERIKRLGAEQSVLDARVELGLAMGVQIPSATLMALDDFPPVDARRLAMLAEPATSTGFLLQAGRLRADIRAAETRLRSVQTLREATLADHKARLDLSLSIGITGQVEGRSPLGSWSALQQPARGPNAAIGLNYTLPLDGDAYQGQLRQRTAVAEQRRIELEDMRATLAQRLPQLVRKLQSSALQLEQAVLLVQTQTRVRENDEKKYRLGATTVLDLLTSESQLTSSQLQEVEARRTYAQALARFRHESGTLLDAGLERQSLDWTRLASIPLFYPQE